MSWTTTQGHIWNSLRNDKEINESISSQILLKKELKKYVQKIKNEKRGFIIEKRHLFEIDQRDEKHLAQIGEIHRQHIDELEKRDIAYRMSIEEIKEIYFRKMLEIQGELNETKNILSEYKEKAQALEEKSKELELKIADSEKIKIDLKIKIADF